MLHDLYTVVGSKTVRPHEKKYVRFKGNKNTVGTLVHTNRGYFIDGYPVDMRSVDLWFAMKRSYKDHE